MLYTFHPESSNIVTISILSYSGDLKSGLVEFLKKNGQKEVGLFMVLISKWICEKPLAVQTKMSEFRMVHYCAKQMFVTMLSHYY